ncbi:hypothetical protein NPA07_05620 [Mycoplasmopsis caviae]|uniref:Lipoprotein-associated type-17 domain-containing protein n=1 Tax=Mycoplasmopsis caviae TaxID=55603 RepID=A0A3P8MEM1_9BACT|nr:hypothetical protein [Mycoplasmopsis caviae]UUD35250.1 hypothetical protein NPA07_05620 [Mycoplasmopsis caviae]VDR41966.1 Uncharacterised protein [Mycoplasmopsis caviae]
MKSNKKKSFLVLNSLPIIGLSTILVSAACSEKVKNYQDKEYLNRLKSRIDEIERMNLFDNLLETNETDVSKIELNRKFTNKGNVDKFKSALEHAKSVNSDADAKSELEKLETSLIDFKTSIKIGTKTVVLPSIKPSLPTVTDWKNFQEGVNGIKFNRFGNLANIFELNSSKTVRETLGLLKDTTKDKDTISNIKVLSYDEYEGKITISAKITSNGIEIGTNEIEMSGFKSFDLPNGQNSSSLKLKLGKLIKEKKKVEQIKDQEIESYIEKFEVLGKKNGVMDIKKLTNEFENHFTSKTFTLTGTKKDELNFKGEFEYKKLDKGSTEVQTIKTKIEFNKVKIDNPSYSDQDVLDYIISTAKIKKDTNDINDAFASSYLEKSNSLNNIALTFIEHENENYFGENRIQTENEKIETNDNDGTMTITYQLAIEDNNNQKTVSNEVKQITVLGFQKIDKEYLSKKLLLSVAIEGNGGNKLKEFIKSEYNAKKYSLDAEWIKSKIGNNQHTFVRKESQGNNESLKFHKNAYFNLLGNGKDINTLLKNTSINFEGEHKPKKQFEIEALVVNFKKIEINEQPVGNKVSFKIIYEVTVSSSTRNKIDISYEAISNGFFNVN